MAKVCKPGDVINGYRIVEHVNTGGTAISFSAKSAGGEKIFFKQVKSPSVKVAWYPAYVAYLKELKRRIEGTRAKNFVYRMIEFFEAKHGSQTLFLAFEFVEGGLDMEQILEQIRAKPASVKWEQRLIWAKVLMAGIDALHEAKIVHCDLKPPNIQLFRDPSIRAGYQLKLIDMDFSILADKPAPWHGHMGYVGSPHYFSPEHLSGKAPVAASDIFTCGLILYELLGGEHPYLADSNDEYAAHAKGYSAPPPKLVGELVAPASNEQVCRVLHRCLSPNPADRPTAKEINLTLNGRAGSAPVVPVPLKPETPVPPVRRTTPDPRIDRDVPVPPKPTSVPAPKSVPTIHLRSKSGRMLKVSIRTAFDKGTCQVLGDEAIYLDTPQFTLDRKDNDWFILPNTKAKHQTLLNGGAIDTPTLVRNGDVVAVGNAARGVQKLPLTVELA